MKIVKFNIYTISLFIIPYTNTVNPLLREIIYLKNWWKYQEINFSRQFILYYEQHINFREEERVNYPCVKYLFREIGFA